MTKYATPIDYSLLLLCSKGTDFICARSAPRRRRFACVADSGQQHREESVVQLRQSNASGNRLSPVPPFLSLSLSLSLRACIVVSHVLCVCVCVCVCCVVKRRAHCSSCSLQRSRRVAKSPRRPTKKALSRKHCDVSDVTLIF